MTNWEKYQELRSEYDELSWSVYPSEEEERRMSGLRAEMKDLEKQPEIRQRIEEETERKINAGKEIYKLAMLEMKDIYGRCDDKRGLNFSACVAKEVRKRKKTLAEVSQ